MPRWKKQPVDSPTGQLSTAATSAQAGGLAGEIPEVPTACQAWAEALLSGRLAVEVQQPVAAGREEAGEEPDVEVGAHPGVVEVDPWKPPMIAAVLRGDEPGDVPRVPALGDQRPHDDLDGGRLQQQVVGRS